MKSLIGEVPDGWHMPALGEIADVRAGAQSKSLTTWRDAAGGVGVVTATDIKENRIVVENATWVRADVAPRFNRYRLEPGDIVSVRIGEARRHALVGEEHHGWLLGNACLLIRPSEHVKPGYLNVYLDHPAVQNWMSQQLTGSAMRILSAGALGMLPVVLPPVDRQAAVAEMLSPLENKIALHREISEATARLRDLLLLDLLAGDLLLDALDGTAGVDQDPGDAHGHLGG